MKNSIENFLNQKDFDKSIDSFEKYGLYVDGHWVDTNGNFIQNSVSIDLEKDENILLEGLHLIIPHLKAAYVSERKGYYRLVKIGRIISSFGGYYFLIHPNNNNKVKIVFQGSKYVEITIPWTTLEGAVRYARKKNLMDSEQRRFIFQEFFTNIITHKKNILWGLAVLCFLAFLLYMFDLDSGKVSFVILLILLAFGAGLYFEKQKNT